MKESIKDLTVNVKKSIDREYDGEFNMESHFDENQKVLDDNVITSIENSYDDYDNIIISPGDDDDDDVVLIEPNKATVDTIRLVKVKTLKDLDLELENLDKTRIPAIIDFKYIQERRVSEYKQVGSKLKEFKKNTNAGVVLLGSTKNVIVVAPEEIRLMK